MKANNLQSVLTNLPEEFKGIEFNQEVSSLEKGHFHILELNKIHIVAEERYITTARVKKYNENSWNAIKEELKNLGYKRMLILHDPTIVEAKEATPRKEAVKESKAK